MKAKNIISWGWTGLFILFTLAIIVASILPTLTGCAGLQAAKHDTYQLVSGWGCKDELYTIKIPSEMPTDWVTTQVDEILYITDYLIMGVWGISEQETVGAALMSPPNPCPGFVGLIWARVTADSSDVRFYLYDSGFTPYEVTEAEFDTVLRAWKPRPPSMTS